MARKIVAVDHGNTAMKLFLSEGDEIADKIILDSGDYEGALRQIDSWNAEGAIVCSSGTRKEEWEKYSEDGDLLILDSQTPLPVRIDYSTPETLGADRIALAAGAVKIGQGDTLIADCGTAVTLDLVLKGVFKGGNISPGLSLRFRSLHEYTALLPLVEASGKVRDFGDDTESAIRSGVINGLVYEITGTMEKAISEYGCRKMILTGGDAEKIAMALSREMQRKMPEVELILQPDLTAYGLFEIYRFNYDKKEN